LYKIESGLIELKS